MRLPLPCQNVCFSLELSKSLSKTEDRLKKVTKDRDDQEKAVDKLRVELSKTEKAKKQLQHQVGDC